MSTVKAYLGLGSNLGERSETLQEALSYLDTSPSIEVVAISSIYATSPVGFLDQPDFYNLVAQIKTTLSPEKLLSSILQIEQDLHRIREVRWGPRTIDIDILLYGEDGIYSDNPQIPHPRMHERAFVLVPLLEIAGDISIPGVSQSIAHLIEELPLEQKVEKVESIR